MRHSVLGAILPIGLLLLSACAVTDMTSFSDPKFAGRQFSSVMVVGDQMPLKDRMAAEDILVREFERAGVRAVRGIDYLPPTRTITEELFRQAVAQTAVQTVLYLALVDRTTKETYIPPIYHPGTSYSTVNVIGNTAYVNTYTTSGYTTGGYSISKPRAAYISVLVDVTSGETIWTAEASSRGNAFASFEQLTISASQEAVRKLIADGLFAGGDPSVQSGEPAEDARVTGNADQGGY